jgi:hypothetical protein
LGGDVLLPLFAYLPYDVQVGTSMCQTNPLFWNLQNAAKSYNYIFDPTLLTRKRNQESSTILMSANLEASFSAEDAKSLLALLLPTMDRE